MRRPRHKLRGELHHPLDVDLADLAERIPSDAAATALLHLTECAGCRCHYGRLRASLDGTSGVPADD